MGLILEEINGMLKNEDISETCKSILYGVVILLVLALVAYIFFGIYFLTIDYHVCSDHHHPTALWIYCFILLTLFLGGISTALYQSIKLSNESVESLPESISWRLIYLIIFQIVLVVYGCIVMYSPGVTCDNLKHTGLWVWVGITLHKQVIVLLYALGVFVYLNYILPLDEQYSNEEAYFRTKYETSREDTPLLLNTTQTPHSRDITTTSSSSNNNSSSRSSKNDIV